MGRAGVVLPVMLLILTGGIGFLTWDDMAKHRFRFRRYRMQSKVILTATALLVLLPAAIFFLGDFAGFGGKERFLASLFQAVTPRTAGFNTVDMGNLTSAGRAMTVLLMLVGGAPGSTAGGVKTTTVAVLLANAAAVIRRRKTPPAVQSAHRRGHGQVRVHPADALSLLVLLGAFLLSAAEGLPFGTCLFETASAIGTVGLSLGITPFLEALSRGVLIGLMFFGRVGALTLLFAAVGSAVATVAQYPLGRINVG